MSEPVLRFPYMVWARTESFVSPFSLAQSGMPAPDPLLLGPPPPIDLAPPGQAALPAVRARLAELFGVASERVLLTSGASGAMHLAAQRWFGPGARVVTEVPSYEPFRALPLLHGAELRTVERRLDEGWRLDLGRVRAALAGASPGHVFVASPHNPSGATLTPDEVVDLARAAEGQGGVLVANEIYMEFARPKERVHAFALAQNAVSIGSLTKAYGLGALRLGWMLLGEGLVGELPRLHDLAYLDGVDLSTPALRLAERALDRLPELLAPVRRLEVESRPVLVDWLARSRALEGLAPALGLATFARARGVSDTRALARYLAADFGVDAAPGEFFGAPGYLRIGYGVPRATLVEGLRRLEEGVLAFRGRSAGGLPSV